jgi:carbamoyl-phosphate synthase large subunit
MIYGSILITGAGGDIGMSIAGIVRGAGAAMRLIGADLRARHAGENCYDAVATLPPASDPAYFGALAALIECHRPEVILPMSEAELSALAAAGCLEEVQGVPVVCANRLALETGLDKLATAERLRRAGIPAPWTRLVGEQPPQDLPCIVKPRHGQGSKGFAVATEETWSQLERTRQGYVWQQLLGDAEEEHTCGLYKPANGPLRTIVFRRKLQGGCTSEAETVFNPAIEAVLGQVAEAVELRGAINVQLRLEGGVPMIFEINPRFSSTVGFRHRLGFRDLIWSLLERRGMAIEDYDPPPLPSRLYRTARIVRY